MKPTLLLLVALAPILALSASHALSAPDAVRGRFDAWAVEFGRSYSSADERETAFAAFQENDAEIEDHNRRGLSFQKGHNQFSDLTEQAWLSRFHTITPNRLGNYPDPRLPKTPVPASNSSFNWASKGAVTPVQNQRACGGCYAFSVAAAMEGAYAIATGKPAVKLSEEDLLECASPPNVLCAGGDLYRTFQWVQKFGIANESFYPFSSAAGGASACQQQRWGQQQAINVGGVHDVTNATATNMLQALSLQPMSTAINPRQLMSYKGGVFDSKNCSAALAHAVTIVGWGTDTETLKPYWLIKNSWGTTWGEKGFLRIARTDKMGDDSVCGVQTYVCYPLGVKQCTGVQPGRCK